MLTVIGRQFGTVKWFGSDLRSGSDCCFESTNLFAFGSESQMLSAFETEFESPRMFAFDWQLGSGLEFEIGWMTGCCSQSASGRLCVNYWVFETAKTSAFETQTRWKSGSVLKTEKRFR
jgi:hypothetical protein